MRDGWREVGRIQQSQAAPGAPVSTSVSASSQQTGERQSGGHVGRVYGPGLDRAADCCHLYFPSLTSVTWPPARLQGRLRECSPVLFWVGKRNGVGWIASQPPPRSTSQLCHLGQRPCFSGPQFPALKNKANPTSPAGRGEPVQ